MVQKRYKHYKHGPEVLKSWLLQLILSFAPRKLEFVRRAKLMLRCTCSNFRFSPVSFALRRRTKAAAWWILQPRVSSVFLKLLLQAELGTIHFPMTGCTCRGSKNVKVILFEVHFMSETWCLLKSPSLRRSPPHGALKCIEPFSSRSMHTPFETCSS